MAKGTEDMTKRILFLGAHPDDVEFGAGGALARFVRTGHAVEIAVFSRCTKSVPPGYPSDLLVTEMKESMQSLDVAQYVILDFPVRDFQVHRQDILEELVRIQRLKKYDLVIAPSATDIHQDHSALGAETARAFQDRSILNYEITKNQLSFLPEFYIEITEEDLKAKIKAIRCYKSQIELRPRFSDPRNIEAVTRVRGMQIRVEFAEAFEASRLIVKEGEHII
jgi:LmbE family N-acetylglucosaminyl deacetylase